MTRGQFRGQFRVEDLNPFMERHLHATVESLDVAYKSAEEIAKKIGRQNRVLSEKGGVVDLFYP